MRLYMRYSFEVKYMQYEVMYTIFIGDYVYNIYVHTYTCICANNKTLYEYA